MQRIVIIAAVSVAVCLGLIVSYRTLHENPGGIVAAGSPSGDDADAAASPAPRGLGGPGRTGPASPPDDAAKGLLDELGSAEPLTQTRAIEGLAKLPWKERCALLRRGLHHENDTTALACAWVLDWKYLSPDELDRKAEILIPHCRRLWDDPILGLEDLANEGDDGIDDTFRMALGFETTGRMLENFPGPPPADLDDTVQGIFGITHRSMLADHVPYLAALTSRDDPLLLQEAFHYALFISEYDKAHFEEVGEMIRRHHPCATRYHESENHYGLGGKPLSLPVSPAALPPLFVCLVEGLHFCEACRKDKSDFTTNHSVNGFLSRWASRLEPGVEDLVLLNRLILRGYGFLKLWAMIHISRLGDRSTVDLLRRAAPSKGKKSDIAPFFAAHARHALGDESGLEDLITSAREGNAMAMLLLIVSAPQGWKDEAATFIEKNGDLEGFVHDARALEGLLGLKVPREALDAVARGAIEEAEDAEELLVLHSVVRGGNKYAAAMKAIELLSEVPWVGGAMEERSNAFPFLEAWAPLELMAFLSHGVQIGDAEGRAYAEKLLGILKGPRRGRAAPQGDPETWKTQVRDTHLGKHWGATYCLSHIDSATEERFKTVLLRGHYGIWQEDEGDFLGTEPADVPALLDMARSNCCALVHVRVSWENIFQWDSDELDVDGWLRTAMTPAEHLAWWHDLTGKRYTLSKISGRHVPAR
ncbi:MAG: hypothetical protein ACYTFG_03615 [Planctomycetota bacterium]|jgi:hypothetical protein